MNCRLSFWIKFSQTWENSKEELFNVKRDKTSRKYLTKIKIKK
jgi:hypothetical protein